MKKLVTLLCFLMPLILCTAVLGKVESLSGRVKSLEPIIGSRPTKIKNVEELKNKYIGLKAELDSLLSKSPNDQNLLFMRGHLQKMGHNFGYSGAWQGASADLRLLLKLNPNNVPALIELAGLWLDYPDMAPEAEKLYRTAQCKYGSQPLEEAQRGLFFAFYYQGKFIKAFRQSGYLKKTWSQDAQYQRINDIAHGVIVKNNLEDEVEKISTDDLVMTGCKD